jgi:hypothetical protein
MVEKYSLASEDKKQFVRRLTTLTLIVYGAFLVVSVTGVVMGNLKIIDGIKIVLFPVISVILLQVIFEYLLGFRWS